MQVTVAGVLLEVGGGERPGEVRVGQIKLFPIQLVADVVLDLGQALRLNGNGDHHAHHRLAVDEVVVGQVHVTTVRIEDVPHRFLGGPGELLGVVVDHHQFRAPQTAGHPAGTLLRHVADVEPAAHHAHAEPAVGVATEAGYRLGQGTAVNTVAHPGFHRSEADRELVVQPLVVARQPVVGNQRRVPSDFAFVAVGTAQGAGPSEAHGLFVGAPRLPSHVFFKDVLPGHQHDGQEQSVGEPFQQHLVQHAAQLGMASEAEPFQDNLGRGADFFGAPGYGVNHSLHVPVNQPEVVLVGVGVAQEPIHLGQIAGHDHRQAGEAAPAAHRLGIGIDGVDAALVAVVHQQALHPVQHPGLAHALGPFPTALVAGGSYRHRYDGRGNSVSIMVLL